MAHHTLGRAHTGDDPDYVVAACSACNIKVGDPLAAKAPTTTVIHIDPTTL